MLLGGGQERELRSGTQNVAGIAAMAAAATATVASRDETVARVAALRDRLADGLRERVPGTHESGVPAHDRSHKVAGSCHLCFEHIESEALLFLLERRHVYASAASSCASGAQEPSHVLAAMGVSRELAQGSLRLSLGWPSTDAEVDLALDAVPACVSQLRAMSGVPA
jgi:cysteine desulfurase